MKRSIAPLAALLILSACDPSGGGQVAGGSNLTQPGGGSTGGDTGGAGGDTGGGGGGTSGGMAIGESCHSSDPDAICIGIKYVVYKNSSGTPISSEADAADNLAGINAIWKQCNIAFQIEKYEEVSPSEKGLPYGGPSAEAQTTAARSAYAEGNTFLVVTTGPWNVTKNAWTSAPGAAPYGVIVDGAIAAGYSEIYAHELGHYVGLDHVGDSSNVMSALIAHSSTDLTSSQCNTARSTAKGYWPQMLR